MGHAEIQLSTRVDNVGAVEISGTINPFGKNQTNDLKIVAKNVDLTPTSPYVGKFAGYRLARGKLELDLDYHLVDRKIRAENKVVLEKFTFGEKVESPLAQRASAGIGLCPSPGEAQHAGTQGCARRRRMLGRIGGTRSL